MAINNKIALAYGDGIGPEIMEATLKVLDAAGADLDMTEIQVGEKEFLKGYTSGISPEAWEQLMQTQVMLKAPITTPQGAGYKSLNVTLRKTFGLYANIRPCVSYYPYVKTLFPNLDIVVIRENEEDLYAGIEHQQTNEVVQCLKLISRPGTEKIIRYAFEYAVANNRKKVTTFVKDNIMKLTDGLFHKIFNEIKQDYPQIEADSWIIDIGTAKLATEPENFDVIVLENLYGDILSDVVAQMTGSIGLGGSANIGTHFAMFEAIHGSAPDIAGKGIANPSGLMLAAVQMLVHINQTEPAGLIHNAWLKTIEDGIHTGDIFKTSTSKQKVNTKEFTQAVIDRLGEKPSAMSAVKYTPTTKSKVSVKTAMKPQPPKSKKLDGVDVFLHWNNGFLNTPGNTDKLASILHTTEFDGIKLSMISNRGAKVYPGGSHLTFCTDHWRCRFEKKSGAPMTNKDILKLLANIDAAGLDFIKIENLYEFDGEKGYSLAQGQ